MKLDYQHKKKLSILTDKIERLRQKLSLNYEEYELKKNTEYIDKNININQVVDEYNLSQFILNIKHEHNVVNGLNMRTFEAIASGGGARGAQERE